MYEVKDIYTCNCCGFTGDWEETDEVHGDLWSCEECGEIFCTKCFIKSHGYNEYRRMIDPDFSGIIMCPDCYGEAN